jgi:hypothetical protein
MRLKKIITILWVSVLLLHPFQSVHAQDVTFTVNILSQRLQLSDKSILNSLQTSITEFLNGRRWSKDKITQQEVLKATLVLDVFAYDPSRNLFSADLQIQSTRPVFSSNYTSMLFNLREPRVTFEYQQFQAMDFQEGNNIFNLTGVLAFYANIILGYDYDSFGELGGSFYFDRAKAILDASQSMEGWRPNDGAGNQNRFYLIDNLLSERLKPLRLAMYRYHRQGLDIMHKDVVAGRKEIEEALKSIQDVCRILPNAIIIKNFFFVKHKEIIDIFKEAPVAEKNRMIDMLRKMDVANSAEYENIRKS